MDTNSYPLKEECYQVIGCAMTVHNELGCGFLEAVYQEALGLELTERRIPFIKEKRLYRFRKGLGFAKPFHASIYSTRSGLVSQTTSLSV